MRVVKLIDETGKEWELVKGYYRSLNGKVEEGSYIYVHKNEVGRKSISSDGSINIEPTKSDYIHFRRYV